MPEEIRDVDLTIIGAGIAGLSLAFEGIRRGKRTVVIDDGRLGATHAATGLLSPRPDYMLSDMGLIQITDRQCLDWNYLFPDIITPKRFIIPIEPDHRWLFKRIELLLKRYERVLLSKPSMRVPPLSRISGTELENLEPNIKKGYFDGALSMWELTVNPDDLLRSFDRRNQHSALYSHVMIAPGSLRFEMLGPIIYKVHATAQSGQEISIKTPGNLMPVVNAAGPWIQEVASIFGIKLGLGLRLGIQLAVPGNYFRSGIITFDEERKYCICLQKNDYVQVGPTNSEFSGHPDEINPAPDDLDRLAGIFKSLLDNSVSVGEYSFLKGGLRVKPSYGDTNRPIIWSHFNQGISNFYTLSPGKMSLGLLAAREFFEIAEGRSPKYALDGNDVLQNKVFLKTQRVLSLAQTIPHLFL